MMIAKESGSMATMNVADLVAIDIHTHAEVSTRMLPDDADREALEARGRYFRYKVQHPTIAQMAAYYRARRMAFVVFTVDHERGMGIQRISNEEVAESAAEHADVAIPFASIDPARGPHGRARSTPPDQGLRRARLQVSSQRAGVLPERPRLLSALRGDRRSRSRGAVS
jgi:predicted TIM-barrel fold metal-dependent hydrolase